MHPALLVVALIRYPESARAQAQRHQLSGSTLPCPALAATAPPAEGNNLTLFNVSPADALRTPQFWLVYAGWVQQMHVYAYDVGLVAVIANSVCICVYILSYGFMSVGSYAIISNGKTIMTECFG